MRRAEARRLATAIRAAGDELAGNKRHLAALVTALAGVSPLSASSGRTTRHRLNRGGDRQLNRALHDITLTRWRADPRTHASIARRRAAGMNDTEIRRALKRYIAREPFRALESTKAA